MSCNRTERPLNGSRNPLRWSVLAGALVVVAAVFVSNYIRPYPPLHMDEVYWIGSAYYFDLAVVRGDCRNPDWGLLPARENPPVGKYAIGLALTLSGRRVDSPDLLGCFYLHFQSIPGAWGAGVQFEKRSAVARRVRPGTAQSFLKGGPYPLTESELMVARRLVLGATLTAALALYWLGCQFCRPGGAVVGSVLFVFHPAVAEASGIALIDGIALALSVTAVVGLDRAVRHALGSAPGRSWGSAARRALFAGTFLGLACATKLNALVVAVLALSLGVFCVVRAARSHRLRLLAPAGTIAVALCWALLLFVVVNPALYSDPIGGLVALVREHQLTAALQQKWEGPAFDSATVRLLPITSLVFVWKPLVLAVVAFVGYRAARGWQGNPTFWLVAAWWLTGMIMLACWLPFAISRYVLPVVPPSALLLGYLAETIFLGLARVVRPTPATTKAVA